MSGIAARVKAIECSRRLEAHKLTYEGENVATTLLGRYKLLDTIREEYAAHLIVVLGCREC